MNAETWAMQQRDRKLREEFEKVNNTISVEIDFSKIEEQVKKKFSSYTCDIHGWYTDSTPCGYCIQAKHVPTPKTVICVECGMRETGKYWGSKPYTCGNCMLPSEKHREKPTCLICKVETELTWYSPFPCCLLCARVSISDERWIGYVDEQNKIDFYKELNS